MAYGDMLMDIVTYWIHVSKCNILHLDEHILYFALHGRSEDAIKLNDLRGGGHLHIVENCMTEIRWGLQYKLDGVGSYRRRV